MAIEHDDGLGGRMRLSGRAETVAGQQPAATSWAARKHPDWQTIFADEARQRASYLADLAVARDFLVPHRFEDRRASDERGRETSLALRRRLGYVTGLNASYLGEIFGQIRRAPATYDWGPLAPGSDPTAGPPPAGTYARRIWNDTTQDGMDWPNFFEGEVLEWMLTSPGGFIVWDVPPIPAESRAEEEARGRRPYARFVPWSCVEDWGTSATGFTWVKILEVVDQRRPKDEKEQGLQKLHVLYELQPDGSTIVGRYDSDGKPVGEERNLGVILDPERQPILPLVPVRFGRHPLVPYAGAGLLRGLADIVIDLYNLRSEMREEFRSIVFGFLAYWGPDGEGVRDQLIEGSRFLHLGNSPDQSGIQYVSPSGEAIAAGRQLYDDALRDWAMVARGKAAKAISRATVESGVALQAEFELDLKPLLVQISEALDNIETWSMFVAAQLAGFTLSEADRLGVRRSTEYRLEDEASRIARIVSEAREAGLPLADEALVRQTMDWYRAAGLDLDAVGPDGTPVRELLEERTRSLASAEQAERERRAESFGGFAALGNLAATGAAE